MAMSRDMKERIWVTKFDDGSLKEFYSDFMNMEHDPSVQIIPIVVTSYGGSLDNLNAMRDIIKSSEKPVSVTAIGKAMSAGLALLVSGTKGLRFVAPGTSLMLHEASSGAMGKVEEIVSYTKHLDELNKLFIKNMAEDMGRTESWLRKEISKRNNADWFMTAEEAVEIGLADAIGVDRSYTSPPQQVIAVDVKEKKALRRKKA